jgi:pimeloyl-ACP methyl ester carboxylesterase
LSGASAQGKVSREFAARLARLAPETRVQAIVLLNLPGSETSGGRRPGRDERAALLAARAEAGAQAVAEIDRLLAAYPGMRLAEQPDLLGALPVTTTADGIAALAASDWVAAIVENQDICPIP